MKNWSLKAALSILSATSLLACSEAPQQISKRGDKAAQLASFNAEILQKEADANPDKKADPVDPEGGEPAAVVIPELKMPALKLIADPALASLKGEVILANKLNATDFILFGNEGKSWSYKPHAPALDQVKAITPVVVNEGGFTLYSLPDNEFWLVSADKLSRRKGAAMALADEKTVTTEQFSTATLLGDKSKMKVLYAAQDELILHLDTYLVILTIMPSPEPAKIKQLPIDKLPVDLKGQLTAGRSADGYWFQSASGLFFLAKAKKDADVSPWSKSALVLDPGDLSSLALYPNETGLSYEGVSLGLSAAGLLSNAAPVK